MPTKQFSPHQTWRSHSLYATRKEVDRKLRASGERSTNQSTRTSWCMQSETVTKSRETGLEFGQDWRTKNRVCIRCEHKRDTMRMPVTINRTESPVENHRFTARNDHAEKISRTSSYEDKVEMQDITRKYKVVNYVEKKTWSGTQISSRRWSSSK